MFAILPLERGPSRFYGTLHLAGQWAIYALIILHLSGVALQVIWGRDGVLGRMLPAYAAEPRPRAVVAEGAPRGAAAARERAPLG